MSNASTTTRDGVLAPGDRLGRYEVISLLARGGMGAVYLARAEGASGFSRLFAIKVMHPHLADEPEFVHMLVDEARVASRIHHPNAVAIVDLAESPHGYYLVMDYIDGPTLTQVRKSPKIPDEIKARIGARILLDALAGLHSAHELTDEEGAVLHIVHRDVSPHNILVGTDGVGRITDFGIALAASRITASRPGLIKGKPQYMAPEQAMAQPVDRRADVFCAGIILWEFLTRGRLFFADSEAAAMMMVVRAPIELPSGKLPLPRGFDEVCMKALERDLDGRFPTARAFADELGQVVDEAGWSMSSNEVAEHVAKAFAGEIAQRKATIRERIGGSVKAMRAPTPANTPKLTDSLANGETLLADSPSASALRAALAESSKETSASVPAIEVAPLKPSEVKTARISVVAQQPPRSPRAMMVAGAAVVLLVGGVWWSRRVPEAPAQPMGGGEARRDAPVPRPLVRAVTQPLVEPPRAHVEPVAPDVTALVVDAAPTLVELHPEEPRAHRRAPRVTDAGAAPSAPTRPANAETPALETNPYLRR